MSASPDAWPQAILFDLDGTLVDSLPDIAGALNDLFRERNWGEFSQAEVRGMVGGGVPKLVERALARRNLPASGDGTGELAARFLELYAPRATKLTRLFPGAREFVEMFSQSGVGLGICTNKPEAITRQILKALGVSGFFGAVVGGDTLSVKKPDPGPVRAALKQLECPAEGAMMVGDSAADARAARAAGIPVILVSFGYSRTPVTEIGCDRVVGSFSELPAAIQKIPRRR